MAKKNDEQLSLFGEKDEFSQWFKEWQGMPEFSQDDQASWKDLIIHFRSREDYFAFAKLIEQKLTEDTQSVWYPPKSAHSYKDMRYGDES